MHYCYNYLLQAIKRNINFSTGPPALTVNITKNTESSSIVVQWDEVDDSLHTIYIVTQTSERDLNNIQIKTLEEQSSYTITGLTLDTVYTITVTASNRCGQGPEYSTIVSLSAIATSTIRPTIATIRTNLITSTATPSTSVTSYSKTATDLLTTAISRITSTTINTTDIKPTTTNVNLPTIIMATAATNLYATISSSTAIKHSSINIAITMAMTNNLCT